MAAFPVDITLTAETLHDPQKARRLEWLETNGIGGYASATVIGAHTRRYHSLLNAAIVPPVLRQSLLTALDVTVDWPGGRRALACHFHEEHVFPPGHLTLERFELDPFPRWTHRLSEEITLIHELWMDPCANTTVMIWRLRPDSPPCRLAIVPLMSLRDHHHLSIATGEDHARLSIGEDRVVIDPIDDDIQAFTLLHTDGQFTPRPEWRRDFHLAVESTRENDWTEARWAPGTLRFDLSFDHPITLIASTEVDLPDPITLSVESLERRLAEERRCSIQRVVKDPAIAQVAPAVRDFLVRRGDGRPTVIAGYPWFTDWGRDTMIAMPGLCLVHGHLDHAKDILRTWMGHIDEGMLPNRFPDQGEDPEYNTVDAALWLGVAALRCWQCFGERGPQGLWPKSNMWKSPPIPVLNQISTDEACFLHEALDAVEKIIAGYTEGTRHGIRVDEDGLVTQGEEGQQLTWMDAKWEDTVFTPRHGKPIEIQALWFNTLCVSSLLWRVHGDLKRAKEREESAIAVQEAAEKAFTCLATPGLADVIRPDGSPDLSIRPNQIFAASLPFPLVSQERCAAVVRTVENHLLTPYGLRSLAPGHPEYIGHYHGPREIRDAAYHQGTVWSWLIGPYIDAALRVDGPTVENAAVLRARLQPLIDHVNQQHGLGSVSEIFDGDEPHAPKGCPAQAWSVSELLRALWTLEGVGQIE